MPAIVETAVMRIGRKAGDRGLACRRDDDRGLLAQLVRELDDEDRVLGDQADEHHQPDLAEQVDRAADAGADTSAPVNDSATATRIVTGWRKLSNCAASTSR
jgi:hypothetical protein